MGWYILGAAAALAINIALSIKFANIAEEKGYSRSAYLWACILLGIVGYILVAALPDTSLYEKVSALEHKLSSSTTTSSHLSSADRTSTKFAPAVTNATITEDGKWVCGACQTENSMNYSQCKKCGRFRG